MRGEPRGTPRERYCGNNCGNGLRERGSNELADRASPGWPLDEHVACARRWGHMQADWVGKLAAVVGDGADLRSLDEWQEWRAA